MSRGLPPIRRGHPVTTCRAGDTKWAYFRLHGSPRIYYSGYADAELQTLAPKLRQGDWCIFDNTAAFHATTMP